MFLYSPASEESKCVESVVPVEPLHLMGASQHVTPVLCQLLQRSPVVIQLLEKTPNADISILSTVCYI